MRTKTKIKRAFRRKTGRKGIRAYVRRKKQVRNRTIVPVGLGFPKQMVMTHKYVEQVYLITNATGDLLTYNFRCNGMYDPNGSGTGHQPYYFDQMTALYNHYTVIGSKARIKFTPNTVTQPTCVLGCYINDDSTVTPTQVSTLMENSNVRYRLSSYAQQTPVNFNMKWSAKKAFGGSILANIDLYGSASADPLEQQYYTLFIDSSKAIATATYLVTIEIDYIAVWRELKDVAGS